MPKERFSCETCGKQFDKRGRFTQHFKTHSKPHKCHVCNRGFALRSDLLRHGQSVHLLTNPKIPCHVCSHSFPRKDHLIRHMRSFHPEAMGRCSAPSRRLSGILPQQIQMFLSDSRAPNRAALIDPKTLLDAATRGFTDIVKAAIEAGVDVHTKDQNQHTALDCAARAGHIDTVKLLLSAGFRPDQSNTQVLHHAVKGQSLEVLRILLRGGFLLPLEDSTFVDCVARTGNQDILQLVTSHFGHLFVSQSSWNMLAAAAKAGQVAMVQFLLDDPRTHVNQLDSLGNSALHHTAQNGNIEITRLLLASKDIDINRRTRSGTTPLHLATSKDHLDVFEAILASESVDLDIEDRSDRLPLHLACSTGNISMIRQLLHKSLGQLNATTRWRQTPLHLAAFHGHIDCVKLLVEYPGIYPRFRDSHLLSALQVAAFGCNWEICQLLLDHEKGSTTTDLELSQISHTCNLSSARIINKVLQHPDFADRNVMMIPYCYGRAATWGSLLHQAAFRGNHDALKSFLREDGFNINLTQYNDWGRTPLMLAVEKGHFEAVAVLLSHKHIAVNFTNSQQETALNIAKRKGDQRIIEMLLEAGATDGTDETGTSNASDENSSLSHPQPSNSADESLETERREFLDEDMWDGEENPVSDSDEAC